MKLHLIFWKLWNDNRRGRIDAQAHICSQSLEAELNWDKTCSAGPRKRNWCFTEGSNGEGKVIKSSQRKDWKSVKRTHECELSFKHFPTSLLFYVYHLRTMLLEIQTFRVIFCRVLWKILLKYGQNVLKSIISVSLCTLSRRNPKYFISNLKELLAMLSNHIHSISLMMSQIIV